MKKYFDARRCLYKQMKMLAEASYQQIPNDGLAQYSDEMVSISKELRRPFFTILLGLLLFDVGIYLFILIKKFFRGK